MQGVARACPSRTYTGRTGTRVGPWTLLSRRCPASTTAVSSLTVVQARRCHTRGRRGIADAVLRLCFSKWLLSGFGLGFRHGGASGWAWRVCNRCFVVTTTSRRAAPCGMDISTIRGVYALQASLEFMRTLGWEEIHAPRGTNLALRAIGSLRSRGFSEVITAGPRLNARYCVDPASGRLGPWSAALAEQSIFVEDRGPVVRASPHFYNTEEDIDRFVRRARAQCLTARATIRTTHSMQRERLLKDDVGGSSGPAGARLLTAGKLGWAAGEIGAGELYRRVQHLPALFTRPMCWEFRPPGPGSPLLIPRIWKALSAIRSSAFSIGPNGDSPFGRRRPYLLGGALVWGRGVLSSVQSAAAE